MAYAQLLFKRTEATFYLFAAYQPFPSNTMEEDLENHQMNPLNIMGDDWGNQWLDDNVEQNIITDLQKILSNVKRNSHSKLQDF